MGASRLLTYHELPEEWKNNRYILSGYRFIPLDRWKELLFSGLQWHNETINIHTHLIGTLSLIYLLCFLWPTTPHTDPTSSTIIDRLISFIFLICAIKCLVCSTAWHLFAGCGTLGPFRRLACGISGLIAASVASAEYYGFYCRPGLATLIPQAHMSYLYGFQETVEFYKPGMPSIFSYLAGLFFYATNWPERIKPGWVFDTLFHSHQFWHVAIVAAIWLHWRAIGVFHSIGRTGFSCATHLYD
ncbi:hemolysin-III related-domain-containing protein [Melampsora americana]|nr:hemolysin-III related-domain-containing protein [Melampsora americana]